MVIKWFRVFKRWRCTHLGVRWIKQFDLIFNFNFIIGLSQDLHICHLLVIFCPKQKGCPSPPYNGMHVMEIMFKFFFKNGKLVF